MLDGRYDHDFLIWTREQAERLRAAAAAGSDLDIDWENVAEEIESLGKSQRRELVSRLGRILEHLFKLAHSPAAEPATAGSIRWSSNGARSQR